MVSSGSAWNPASRLLTYTVYRRFFKSTTVLKLFLPSQTGIPVFVPSESSYLPWRVNSATAVFFSLSYRANGKAVGTVDKEVDFERDNAFGLLSEFARKQRVKFRVHLRKIKLRIGGAVF